MKLAEYRLVSRKYKIDDTCINIGSTALRGPRLLVFANPCTVENADNLMKTASVVKNSGAIVLRGRYL